MLDGGIGFGARRIGPMRVCIMVIQIVAHPLNHVTRHLRTARAVKIGDGIAVVYAFERGEMFSDLANWRDFLLLEGCCRHLAHLSRNSSFRFFVLRARIKPASDASTVRNRRAISAFRHPFSEVSPVARPHLRKGITRSEEHTSELQSRLHLVCRL